MSTGDAAPVSASSIGAVTIRPPEFNEAHSTGWFAILEAQFAISNISSSRTKFYHTLSALPASLISRLSPSILSGADYADLKEAISVLVEKSKPELFNSLTASHKIVGRPSTFLQELKNTADKVGVGDDFVRHRFLQAVPASLTPVLAAQTTLNLDQLGVLADELASMSLSSQSTHDIGHITREHTRDRQFSPGRSRQSYRDHHSQQIHHHQDTGSRSRIGIRPYYENQKPKVCRAHLYYGPEARTCRSWCTWPTKTNCRVFTASRQSSREASPTRPTSGSHGPDSSN